MESCYSQTEKEALALVWKTTIAHLNSVKQLDCDEEYDFIRAVVESCVPVELSPKEIEEASYSDEELCLVKNCVKSGIWEQCTITSYTDIKDELCTCVYQSESCFIYCISTMTVHNLLLSAYRLCMNYVTKTFLLVSSQVSGNQLLCSVHVQGQKRDKKHSGNKELCRVS